MRENELPVKEVAAAWVEALESGQYTQARFRLRNNNSFCCLGVLCDISGLGTWEGRDYVTPFDRYRTDLPEEVELLLGADAGQYAIMNDQGASFTEIAAVIRKDAGL